MGQLKTFHTSHSQSNLKDAHVEYISVQKEAENQKGSDEDGKIE